LVSTTSGFGRKSTQLKTQHPKSKTKIVIAFGRIFPQQQALFATEYKTIAFLLVYVYYNPKGDIQYATYDIREYSPDSHAVPE